MQKVFEIASYAGFGRRSRVRCNSSIEENDVWIIDKVQALKRIMTRCLGLMSKHCLIHFSFNLGGNNDDKRDVSSFPGRNVLLMFRKEVGGGAFLPRHVLSAYG